MRRGGAPSYHFLGTQERAHSPSSKQSVWQCKWRCNTLLESLWTSKEGFLEFERPGSWGGNIQGIVETVITTAFLCSFLNYTTCYITVTAKEAILDHQSSLLFQFRTYPTPVLCERVDVWFRYRLYAVLMTHQSWERSL